MRTTGGLSAFGHRQCGQTAISNWRTLMKDEILDIIVECTNDKARSLGAHFVTDKHGLVKFIGVSILIGVYKRRSKPVCAMWSETEGQKCISQLMQCNRFQQITVRCIILRTGIKL